MQHSMLTSDCITVLLPISCKYVGMATGILFGMVSVKVSSIPFISHSILTNIDRTLSVTQSCMCSGYTEA